MIGTMSNIMLMINNTIIQNQTLVREKSMKVSQKKMLLQCKPYQKNRNKKVIRKTKIRLKHKKKLQMKRKKKRVHLLMKSKHTKLNKDNSMFKMQKMKIQNQINPYLISIQRKKNHPHLMKKILLRLKSLCKEFQSRILIQKTIKLKPI